jgi:hypothetical protein
VVLFILKMLMVKAEKSELKIAIDELFSLYELVLS